MKNIISNKSDQAFLKIRDAAKVTGLSQYFLRQNVKSGRIPTLRSGTVYYIDMRQLNEILSPAPTPYERE